MSEEAEIKQIMPPYYTYMVDKLNQITYAEMKQHYIEALHDAFVLPNKFPKRLREPLEKERQRILKRFKDETGINFEIFYVMKLSQSLKDKIYMIAADEEYNFLAKITEAMDSQNMLSIKYGAVPQNRTKPHIGEQNADR